MLGRAAVGAELLVVGSRGTTMMPGTRFGSVSSPLTHNAPCPLLIVPADAEPVEDAGTTAAVAVEAKAGAPAAVS